MLEPPLLVRTGPGAEPGVIDVVTPGRVPQIGASVPGEREEALVEVVAGRRRWCCETVVRPVRDRDRPAEADERDRENDDSERGKDAAEREAMRAAQDDPPLGEPEADGGDRGGRRKQREDDREA